MLLRATLYQISFFVGSFLPALPATVKSIYTSRDERNSLYHLNGKSRPGVLTIDVHGSAWGAFSARDYADLAACMARVFDGPVFVADQNL